MVKSGGRALVTGASSGIGAALARLFGARGHDLVLVARRRERLDELATEMRDRHRVQAAVITADLADPGARLGLWDEIERAGLGVEFLINNAGFATNGPFAALDLERELSMVEVNIKAVVHLTHLVLPSMLARGSGRILNVASTAGFVAGPFMATYHASKAFVVSFTEALAHELGGTGVTATVVCPGPTTTEFADVAGVESTSMFSARLPHADSVARYSYEALLAGKTTAIHGLRNKLLARGGRLSPRSLISSAVARANRP